MKYLAGVLLISLFVGVSLAGCQGDGLNTISEDSMWELESFDSGGEEIKVLPGTNITLKFEEENKFGGSAGCNSYGGSYEVGKENSNSISMGSIVSTEKWCLNEGIMDQESRFLSAMQDVSSYEVTPDHLKLFYDNGNSSLNFIRLD
ncbi:MAG: META domain-containing protein [Candidatus Hadarchaeota archaeon]